MSSAYVMIFTPGLVGWGISAVNKRYKIGARIEPCGTPAVDDYHKFSVGKVRLD